MSPKKLAALRQSNYMQLRKLCEASGDSPEPSGASIQTGSEDLLRLVSTILECHSRGILEADKALHAIRELVRE